MLINLTTWTSSFIHEKLRIYLPDVSLMFVLITIFVGSFEFVHLACIIVSNNLSRLLTMVCILQARILIRNSSVFGAGVEKAHEKEDLMHRNKAVAYRVIHRIFPMPHARAFDDWRYKITPHLFVRFRARSLGFSTSISGIFLLSSSIRFESVDGAEGRKAGGYMSTKVMFPPQNIAR